MFLNPAQIGHRVDKATPRTEFHSPTAVFTPAKQCQRQSLHQRDNPAGANKAKRQAVAGICPSDLLAAVCYHWGYASLATQKRFPIFKHRLQTRLPHGGGHLPHRAVVVDGELLQLLFIPLGIATRLGTRLGRHLGDAKAHRAVAKGGGLAGGEGQIQRGREEAPGADKLGQLAIRHDHGRLQPTGAGAQAREGERVAALPVVTLKPGEVLGDEVAVGAPVRRETDQRPQPYLVDTGAAEPIRRGEAPCDVPLVAAQVMAGVSGGVVGLLIDHDRIEAEGLQLGVFGLREGLHLHPYRAEVTADDGQHLAKIG